MVGNMKRLDEFLLIIKELGVEVDTDSDESTPYLVIPNTRNPKWLMPLDKKSIKKNSFLLYQASTIKGKILKKIYESMPNIVIKILFFNNIIYLNTEKFLYDLNNKNNKYSYSFFLGTEGSDCKTTIQVSNESKPVMYLKLTKKPNVKKLFYNENEILNFLKNTMINNKCPDVLINQEYKGWDIFAISTTKSIKSTFNNRLTNEHVDFLAELYKNTKREPLGETSKYFSDSICICNRYLKKNPKDIWILDIFKDMVSNLEYHGISVCTSHRDFTMWNCYFNYNDIFVFDWEYASQTSLPFFDILHFIIQPAILNDIDEKNIYKELTNNTMIERYAEKICISIELINYFIILYLIDIILLYDSKIEVYKEEDIRVKNNRLKLLNYIMEVIQ